MGPWGLRLRRSWAHGVSVAMKKEEEKATLQRFQDDFGMDLGDLVKDDLEGEQAHERKQKGLRLRRSWAHGVSVAMKKGEEKATLQRFQDDFGMDLGDLVKDDF